MKYYRSYMDRQEISPAAHEKLLNLRVRPRRAPHRRRAVCAALAACAVLLLGVGVWRLTHGASPAWDEESLAASPLPTSAPTEPPEALQTGSPQDSPDSGSFVVNSPADREQFLSFYSMPAINFQRLEDSPALADRALAPGSFWVELEKEDIQRVFWGSEFSSSGTEQQDLPWALFWDGYTVRSSALYDAQGQLTELNIYGEKGRSGFSLALCQGALPFSCVAGQSQESVSVSGVSVTGWSSMDARDGDGQTDYTCVSEFMTKDDTGVRFRSWNNGSAEDGMEGERWFNTLLVRQALTDGLYLDHLLSAESVPAWREVTFDTLDAARQEAAFAPYLPQNAPSGAGEFFGRLRYQEGYENTLYVSWVQGYDIVEVRVSLPEGDTSRNDTPVDIRRPESYDTRLYEIPWCDSVPEEYQTDFYSVTFRAEDMSLDAVKARVVPHDTGGESFHFSVLHENGVVVRYSCDGMTAEQVWALVEDTLS